MTRKRMSVDLTTPDLIILSFLMERPLHGYQLAQELKERQVEDWAGVSRPQVYYSLKKLEASGLIRGESEGNSSLGPERRVFSLAAGASAALADALESEKWAASRPVQPFSTWAMLSVYARKPAVMRMIARRRNFLQGEIDRERATLGSVAADDRSARVAESLIALAIKEFELEISWLDEYESIRDSNL
jgi:DNA-binding PadR family transcriptional regulator